MENNEAIAQIAVGTASLLDRLKALVQESYFTESFEQAKDKRKIYQAKYDSDSGLIIVQSYFISSIRIYHLKDSATRRPQIVINLEAIHGDGSTHSLGSDYNLNNFFSTPEEAKNNEVTRLQKAITEIKSKAIQ